MQGAHISSAVGAVAAQMAAMQQAQQEQLQMRSDLGMDSHLIRQLNSYANAVPCRIVEPKRDPKPLIDRGDRILDDIAFWQPFPVIGKHIAESKAEQLDSLSAELERIAELACD